MIWIYLYCTIYKGCLGGIYGFLNLIKRYPRIKKYIGNKSAYRGKPGGGQFSIRRVNENQQAVLMIINKSILLRNENGYRFHSHQSTANLNLRTQSTTIPNTLISKVLYIYKKRKCVESLTIPGSWLTGLKVFAILGTSTTQQAYWTFNKSSQPRRRGNLDWYA